MIALDASSTARELAEALPDAPLTVITCSLAVVQALHSKPDIRMIVSGGVVDPTTQSLVGPLAERAFERFPSGTLFLSCAGVEFDRGLSLVTHEHARLKRKMIDCAARAILMVDASKLGQRSVEVFAPLADMGLVITDARADLAFVRKLRRAGVAVEVARR